jgi:pyridoxine 5-phosphate synthase
MASLRTFECAATDEMQAIALRLKPHAVCLVPENRAERTTEGGLDVAGDANRLATYIAPLRDAGCRVSMFIGHDARQIEASARIGAAVVELHTGHYSDLLAEGRTAEAGVELDALRAGAALAHGLGLEVHMGHGLTYDNVAPIAAIPQVMELNIGHFLIGEAVFLGLESALDEMRRRMDDARQR